MFGQGISKGGTAFHTLLDLEQDLFEGRLFLLRGKDIQALYQWQAGVDHGGKLPGKDHQVLGVDTAATKRGHLKAFLLLLDRDTEHTGSLQLGLHRGGILRLGHPFLNGTGAGLSFPGKLWHGTPPSESGN